MRPVQLLRGGRANTVRRSRRQISRHYDLGNDLFAAMLDDRMMYSSAIFATPHDSLENAQLAKLDAICTKLELRPDDHLLEIGTGWGGLAIHAASRYGCRVTTTTISREQHREAVARVRAAGVADRVTVLLRDYRELEDTYDKLVAIEMIEAVGWRNFDDFFERVSELVEPDGLALLQAILIDDRAFDVEKAGTSFITTFIFPGGGAAVDGGHGAVHPPPHRPAVARRRTSLPTTSSRCATGASGSSARAPQLEAAGYDPRFQRLWELYLRYCEAGFMERRITDVQALFAKPGYRSAAVRPVPRLAGEHAIADRIEEKGRAA